MKRIFFFFLASVLIAVSMFLQGSNSLKEVPSQSNTSPISMGVLTLASAQLYSLKGAEPVSLPYVLRSDQYVSEGSRARFTMFVDLPQAPEQPLGIYISKVSLGAQLYLNAQWVGACATAELGELRCLHRPWLEIAPMALWKPGRNVLEVEVHADGRQMNGLSVVRVGPAQVLDTDLYMPRYLMSVQVLRALSWITGSLGVLCLVVALYLRGPSMYWWAGLACIANALSNINFLAVEIWPTTEIFAWFAYSTRLASVPLAMLACVAFYGKDRPWQQILAVTYAVIAPLLVWVSGSSRDMVGLLYLPLMLLGVAMTVQLIRWSWASRKLSHVLMTLAYMAMLAAGFYDWLRLRGDSAFEGIYLLAYVSSGFMVMIASFVTAELVSGFLRARELAITLEQRVAQREQQLEEIYA